jgi:signal transduction histidine kinase
MNAWNQEEIAIQPMTEFKFNPMILDHVLKNLSEIILVVNQDFIVVYSNQVPLNLFGTKSSPHTAPILPGHFLGCIHSMETKEGCGTTKFCNYCGIRKTIRKSQIDRNTVIEESKTPFHHLEQDHEFELRIKATSFDFEGEVWTFISILDVSSEYRREVLERIFFHDVINKASGIKGIVELLCMTKKDPMSPLNPVFDILRRSSEELIEEIMTQRDLVLAENNELEVKNKYFWTLDFLNDIVKSYVGHEVAKGKEISISEGAQNLQLLSDQVLLSRVMINLMKNALEASEEGMTVLIGCGITEDLVVFSVKNDMVMTEEVKCQLFSRSFSTKGKNRGLGTYSIKLLTEKYLRGKVDFSSNDGEGTVFHIYLPK